MAPQSDGNLLGAADPPPVIRHRSAGRSPFLLLGDHAGCAIPSSLGDLGLPESERHRHIGWDIGVAGLGRALSERLDATFLSQHYSRLVIDCNRDPASEGAMPDVSDGTAIPGNAALSAADRAARVAAIHAPYHAAISETLDARISAARPTIVIALHSFTPIFGGSERPWHVGVLHGGGDARFARAVLDRLGQEAGLVIGDNQPYRMDETDHSVPRHCFPRGLPYLELEVRQDLIAATGQQQDWAERLARVFADAAPLSS